MTARQKAADLERLREEFISALDAYVDAKIRDAASDAEWRNGAYEERRELDTYLAKLLGVLI